MMKPVAWISESEFSHADTGGEHMLVKVRQAENYTIPLYTAPRELSAKESYDKACIDGEDKDPIERLRFYCSLAMTGQDWLDAEPFFDALKSAPRELSDDEVVIPRELAASYLKITEVPRYKRILEDALKKASEK